MAVTTSRSQRQALLDGMTDGKYRKTRVNTEVAPGTGEELMMRNRQHLHVEFYDLIAQQIPQDQRAIPA